MRRGYGAVARNTSTNGGAPKRACPEVLVGLRCVEELSVALWQVPRALPCGVQVVGWQEWPGINLVRFTREAPWSSSIMGVA